MPTMDVSFLSLPLLDRCKGTPTGHPGHVLEKKTHPNDEPADRTDVDALNELEARLNSEPQDGSFGGTIGVLFGCFARKVVPGGFLSSTRDIHLFPLKVHLCSLAF